MITSLAHGGEPDDSGIGGTGVHKPSIDNELFNRPEIPELFESPEAPDITAPDHSIPDIDIGAAEQIDVPESSAD